MWSESPGSMRFLMALFKMFSAWIGSFQCVLYSKWTGFLGKTHNKKKSGHLGIRGKSEPEFSLDIIQWAVPAFWSVQSLFFSTGQFKRVFRSGFPDWKSWMSRSNWGLHVKAESLHFWTCCSQRRRKPLRERKSLREYLAWGADEDHQLACDGSSSYGTEPRTMQTHHRRSEQSLATMTNN